MKKLICLMLAASLLLCMAGCKKAEPKETPSAPSQENKETQKLVQYENTYWTAVKYIQKLETGDVANDLPNIKTEDSASWWVDVLFLKDGTFRIRDVINNYYDGYSMEGTWQKDENNRVKISSANWLSEWESGAVPDDKLPIFAIVDGTNPDEADYIGMLKMDYNFGPMYFKSASMPNEDLMLCVADMYDEWTMESYEVEGYISDGKDEGIVATMSFNNTMGEAKVKYSNRSAYSGVTEEFTAEMIYIEDAIYKGCGNDEWSVKLMPIDYDNTNGVEYYITLTDKDTILLQRRFTFDGSPAVSYETYKRNK